MTGMVCCVLQKYKYNLPNIQHKLIIGSCVPGEYIIVVRKVFKVITINKYGRLYLHSLKFMTLSWLLKIRMFKLTFITERDTKIQTFQYRLIQTTIPCNKWLHNITIKNCSVCDYCMNVDDLPHFFIRCLKVKEFWLHWFNWLESLSGIVIRNSQVIEECILFGFPSNSDVMQVFNFCILYLYPTSIN